MREDGLKDLLLQDTAPLPLLPDIMGIMGMVAQSRRRASELSDTESQPETVRSINSWNIEQGDLDMVDIESQPDTVRSVSPLTTPQTNLDLVNAVRQTDTLQSNISWDIQQSDLESFEQFVRYI